MGGAETWLMEVLRFWAKTAGHQIDFLLTGGRPGIFDDEARDLGARIFYMRYSRASLLEFAKEFRHILRANRYDAVHDHQDYAAGWRLLIGLGALPPVRVVHVHNAWQHIQTNYAVSSTRKMTAAMGKRLVSSLATHVTGTSSEILVRYGFAPDGTKGAACKVLYCGIDAEKFGGMRDADRHSVRSEFDWNDSAKIVLFVGRLDSAREFDHPQNSKNSWFALNAVRAALTRDPDVRLLMAGGGDALGQLNDEVRSWGLDGKLRILGVRTDIPRLMRASDVLLFPSRQEGLGMVAVEAQAAGLPVLASTGVPRECVVIQELYDALPLSEPLQLWADTLMRVAGQPRLAPDVCRAAFQSSDFSIEKSTRKLEAIYRSAGA
jgi:glycosyltransferase EpsF